MPAVPDSADPFGTAALRRRVLDAWAAAPARFREDANAEEDLARGSYRDRVVVELAQNAADAASRGGVAGRLSLRLAGRELVASNTGAPLDPEGAESLSTLRASAKREAAAPGLAGRFGVGFAAVLAVTDQPRLASTTGALRWSADEARAAAQDIAGLADELARRRGHLATLRLPWPADDRPEDGFATTVRLPLRDDDAVDLVRRLLGDVDDALLLALPALDEIVVDDGSQVRAVNGAQRWHVVRRSGVLAAHLLRDRPVEERDRPWWSLTLARPLDGQPVPPSVHAPTPSDEPLDLPVLLIASFPLDPGRRHVAPGPLTDFLVERAAAAYAELAAEADDPLALVPGPMAAGPVDGAVRAAVLAALADAPVLHLVTGGRVHARDAVAVPGAGDRLLSVLAEVLPGLVADHRALARLGVRRLALADVIDELAEVDRDPVWWRGLYDALAEPGQPGVLESLGALPVPLADGRVVRGPRGLLVAAEDGLPAGLGPLRLRVVHPDASHPVLLRLGAVEATARLLLEQPEVRAAVENAWDDDSPGQIAEAVLALVAAADVGPGELDWLGGLVLTDDEGESAAARDLVVPGSLFGRVADREAVGRPEPDLLDRWGARVLAATGVLAELTLLREQDVLLDASADDGPVDVDDAGSWARAVLARLRASEVAVVVPELVAVRDLDLVSDGGWGQVLAALAGDRRLRAAVTEPCWVVLGDGRRVGAPSYTSWWLRTHARPGGRAPTSYAAAGAADLIGLYDVAPAVLAGTDAGFLEAIGVRTSLAALLATAEGAADVLDRLADPARTVSEVSLTRVYTALAGAALDDVPPPERVRVSATEIVDADAAVVLDAPQHLQLAWSAPPLVVPLALAGDLASVLDIDTTSGRLGDVSVGGGAQRETPAVARDVLVDAPALWWEHDDLVVSGAEVSWWVDADGRVHASTLDGLARGLAWSVRRWDLRLLVAAVLETPQRLGELLSEARLESP